MVSLDQAVAAMLDVLTGYLPPVVPQLPRPRVGVASFAERPVGLGAHRGSESRGSFPAVALKGVRLDALARFQLGGGDLRWPPPEVLTNDGSPRGFLTAICPALLI